MSAWERSHRLPLGAEIALAFATGAGTFVLAAVALAGIETGVVVAFLGAVFLIAVVAIARLSSIAYAVPAGMAGMLAYDWFYLPPTHPLELPDSANLVDLIVYLGVAALLGELAAHAGRRTEAAEHARAEIADEQTALRRVATLVARGAPAHELFAAVAAEAGTLLDVHGIRIARYADGTELVHVAEWSKPGYDPPPYDRAKLEGRSVSAQVLRTGRAARIDNYQDVAVRAAFARGVDLKSVVGAPVVVQGRRWGVMVAWSASGPLPLETERRLTDFAELIATAIANTEARDEVQRLADEQATLRRVATLVAEDVPSSELFGAVAREVGTLLGADYAGMIRFEDRATVSTVATWASVGEHPPVPDRWPMEPGDPAAMIAETRQAARVEDWAAVPGPIAAIIRAELDVSSSVGCPITVQGRLWGALAVHSKQSEPLAADTEARIARFAELVATAIANAEARMEVERLAAEQAALRRVATLVAGGASPTAVFDAVAAEMEGLLDADGVTVSRYEPGGEVVLLAHHGVNASRVPPGTRVRPEADSVTATVRSTGRPARMERYGGTQGAIARLVEILGVRAAVGAPIVVDGGLWGVVIATWRGEESPPGDTEERMAQFAGLLDTAIANADSRDQLTASRARLLTEGDEARRRVVRDLHDGAQQRLVHTIVTLKLAQRAMGEDDEKAGMLVGEALEHAQRGNAELRELAHGILPAVLTRGGLRAGLDAVVARLELPVAVDVPSERFAGEIEASAYFIVAEALTNVVKHAHAGHAEVTASVRDATLQVEVHDDGIGGADPDGRGLVGIRDRVTALGGRLKIESPAGGGTLVAATLPL